MRSGFFVSAALVLCLCLCAQAQIPSEVTGDSRILPAEPTSHLEIYADGQWSREVSDNFDPAKPTVVLIHGWRPHNIDENGHIIVTTLDDYWASATTALAERVNRQGVAGDINLLGWNWIIEASTAARPLPVVVPVENVFNEGLRLAKALQNLQPTGKIHILGHSLGAKVAGVTATHLPALPIDQVTLFDGPEIDTTGETLGNLLDTTPVYLHDNIRLLLSRNIFVDSYSSAFGTSYQEQGIHCADLNMKPPLSVAGILETAIEAHHYPINWYFGGSSGTLGSPEGTINSTSGNISQSVGAAWSKIFNRTDSLKTIDANRQKYTLGSNPSEPVLGLQYELFSRDDPYSLVPITSVRADKEATTSDIAFKGGSYSWKTQGNVAFVDNEDTTEAVLTTASDPVFLSTTMTVPDGQVWMTFDFQLVNPQPQNKLTVFIGSKLLWSFSGSAFPDSDQEFLATDPIDLTGQSDETLTLTFCYSSSSPDQVARIKNIALSSKEKKPFYRLKTKISMGGNIFPQDRIFEKDTTVTLRAMPLDGYRIWAWRGTDNPKSVEDTNTLTMNDNATVRLYFIADSFPACLWTSLGIPLILGFGFSLLGKLRFRD